MYDVIVFDMNNLYYRASWVEENSSVVLNNLSIQTEGIIGSLKMILYRIKKYLNKDGICYFIFDNAKTNMNRRLSVDPSYKSNRRYLSEAFYRGMDYLELILRNFKDNYYVVRERSTEADDWVLPIINELPNKKILLESTDMDWSRCISDNIHWLVKNNVITKEIFYEKYSFKVSVSNVSFFKTFYGDKIDDIPKLLPNLPFTNVFLKIIEKYDNIFDFVEDVSDNKVEYINEAWINKIISLKDKLYKNWQLVSFIPIEKADMERYSFKTSFINNKLLLIYKKLKIDYSFDKRFNKSPKQMLDKLTSGKKYKRK